MPFGAGLFIFSIVVILFSVVLHEVAHGYMARALGDDTAERAGRLTLNPLKHLDPVGSILLPILGAISHFPVIAWAKPVPYNPAMLVRDRQHGPLKVALAGPATNLGLLLVFGLAARFMLPGGDTLLIAGLTFVALVNASLAVFNLIPIPPLDGSKLIGIFSPRLSERLDSFGFGGILVLFALVYLAGGLLFQASYFLVSLVASPAALAVYAGILG